MPDEVVIRSALVHWCPHVEELDVGSIELTFTGEAPELHSVRRFLEHFATRQITHEDVTDEIFARWPSARVVTYWTTAGMDIECRRDPVCLS